MRNLLELMRQIGTRKGRLQFGRFRIEGIRLVERAIRANVELEGIIVGETFARSDDVRERALLSAIEQRATQLDVVRDAEIRTVLGGRKLGDVVAAACIPTELSLHEILSPTPKPQLMLGIVDVVEPGNVGAMIRTAHGLGVTGILTCGASDPFHPKAVRTAMGSLFRLPILQYKSAQQLLRSLHENGVQTAATVARDGQDIAQFVWEDGALAILVGNEFEGLSAEIIQQTNHQITIPMPTTIDSFSVSAAAAICLYQLTNSTQAVQTAS